MAAMITTQDGFDLIADNSIWKPRYAWIICLLAEYSNGSGVAVTSQKAIAKGQERPESSVRADIAEMRKEHIIRTMKGERDQSLIILNPAYFRAIENKAYLYQRQVWDQAIQKEPARPQDDWRLSDEEIDAAYGVR